MFFKNPLEMVTNPKSLSAGSLETQRPGGWLVGSGGMFARKKITPRRFHITSTVFGLSLCLLGYLGLVTAQAQEDFDFLKTDSSVGVAPANPGQEPITRAWFVETIEAGQSLEQTATLVNNSDQDLPVVVMAKDSLQTAQGGFSFKENQDADTVVGSWVEFVDNPKQTIPAKSNLPFRFKINVPEGTEPGEYAGVLAVQEDRSGNNQAGVQVVLRIGARMYITVPGDLKTNTEVSYFEFLTDIDDQYRQFLERNTRASYKNIYLNIGLKNSGNIYTKVIGTAKIIDPTGQEHSQPFNRELVGDSQTEPSWVHMQQQWQVGTYKAIYEWQNKPVIDFNKDGVTDETPTNKKEIEFEMTQEQLDAMAKIQAEADQVRREAATYEIEGRDPALNELASSEATKNNTDLILYVIIGGLAGIVLVMGGVITWFMSKRQPRAASDSMSSDSEDFSGSKE